MLTALASPGVQLILEYRRNGPRGLRELRSAFGDVCLTHRRQLKIRRAHRALRGNKHVKWDCEGHQHASCASTTGPCRKCPSHIRMTATPRV